MRSISPTKSFEVAFCEYQLSMINEVIYEVTEYRAALKSGDAERILALLDSVRILLLGQHPSLKLFSEKNYAELEEADELPTGSSEEADGAPW